MPLAALNHHHVPSSRSKPCCACLVMRRQPLSRAGQLPWSPWAPGTSKPAAPCPPRGPSLASASAAAGRGGPDGPPPARQLQLVTRKLGLLGVAATLAPTPAGGAAATAEPASLVAPVADVSSGDGAAPVAHPGAAAPPAVGLRGRFVPPAHGAPWPATARTLQQEVRSPSELPHPSASALPRPAGTAAPSLPRRPLRGGQPESGSCWQPTTARGRGCEQRWATPVGGLCCAEAQARRQEPPPCCSATT